MVNIKFITSKDDDYKFVKNIRTAVFTDEQGADADKEFDSLESISDFALLYENENAVATARLVKTAGGHKIGRIAVLKQYRGRGYGDTVVRAVTQRAFDYGADTVYVDAQNYAVPFYEKIGFKAVGRELMDRGLPHIPMSVSREEYYGKEKD